MKKKSTQSQPKKTRKEVNKEKQIIPIINCVTDIILHLGSLERGYKGISTQSIKETKALAYKLKKMAENNLLKGHKTTKEYKKILKSYKEDKLYYGPLFKDVR